MLSFDYSNVLGYVQESQIEEFVDENIDLIKNILSPDKKSGNDLGWINIGENTDEELLTIIKNKALEIREHAEFFVLIGVGGSNQGARAVIESIGDSRVKLIYAGNNLSPNYLNSIMGQIEGKSVYVNVIAKNFATLEPGITFRVIRRYMENIYGQEEAGKRIIATGSLNNSTLEILGKKKGYTLLPFPLDVGGRFSVLTAVGLMPIAVSGVDIDELLKGAREMKRFILSGSIMSNPAVQYAAIRNLLLKKGFSIEIMAYFEPMMAFFSKWWVQLFGESEGKNLNGIFPTACSFSEDLHSLGQYIQEGKRIIIETFINLLDQGSSFMIPNELQDIDAFSYIQGKDFAYLNKTAYEATIKAHVEGGVPCMVLNVPRINAYYFGQLFFFYAYACYFSASFLGVNPFNQPGVEKYKTNMSEFLS